MKSKAEKIELVKQLIETAEKSLNSAKELLSESGGREIKTSYVEIARSDGKVLEGGRVIEGVFNGEEMIGPDGKDYTVPANYASKSKLVAGDKLKLTIKNDGTFLYKQIGPIDRKRLVGTLMADEGNYMVLAGTKTYKVLYASVTYFKSKAGDSVTIIVPEGLNTDWAAIENVLPQNIAEQDKTEPKKGRIKLTQLSEEVV